MIPQSPEPQASPYRWAALAVTMLANAAIQFFWICYSPVSSKAEAYFDVSGWWIGALAMIYMIVYIAIGSLMSQLINRFGHYRCTGIALIITTLAGTSRGLVGDDYKWVFVCTLALAVAQPMTLNGWMVFANRWFPARQRTTALGLLTASNLIGMLAGLLLPGLLLEDGPLSILSSTQLWAGIVTAGIAVLFIVVAREHPPVPFEDAAEATRLPTLAGFGNALKTRPFVVILVMFYVGMGAFTGVLQWIGDILAPLGFSGLDAALSGAALLGIGSVSSVLVGSLVDRTGREVPFFVGGFLVAAAGCFVLAYSLAFVDLAIGATLVGVGLISLMPIALSYAAKITVPTSESTTNAIMQLAGQSSVTLVGPMYLFKSSEGLYWSSLIGVAVLLMLMALVGSFLPDAREYLATRDQEQVSREAPSIALAEPLAP